MSPHTEFWQTLKSITAWTWPSKEEVPQGYDAIRWYPSNEYEDLLAQAQRLEAALKRIKGQGYGGDQHEEKCSLLTKMWGDDCDCHVATAKEALAEWEKWRGENG